MPGSLVNATYLSYDGNEDPVDFPDARMEVIATTRGLAVQIWSAEMQEASDCTNQIELTLSPDQARWLAGRLDAEVVSLQERPLRRQSLH